MPFNPRSLKNLRKIIDRTGGPQKTKIVLTSSWRRSKHCMIVLQARLIEYGIKITNAYTTPHIDGYRGKEILAWLKNEEAVLSTLYADNKKYVNHKYDISKENNFIIIDDEMYDIKEHFNEDHIVKTDFYKGLTYLKTIEAIHKLNNFYR